MKSKNLISLEILFIYNIMGYCNIQIHCEKSFLIMTLFVKVKKYTTQKKRYTMTHKTCSHNVLSPRYSSPYVFSKVLHKGNFSFPRSYHKLERGRELKARDASGLIV